MGEGGSVIGVAVATLTGGQALNFAVASKHVSDLLAAVGPMESVAVASSAKPRGKEAPSMVIGGPGIEKVIATDVLCSREYQVGAFECNFSVRNTLDIPVKNIRYLAVLRDGRGQPVDAREGNVARYKTIRPGLALRTSNIDGRFQIDEETKRLVSRIEVRILGFEPVQ